jgi:acetylornithine deacetylase/succinyl-diaminopimelate desuccinylase-like protein
VKGSPLSSQQLARDIFGELLAIDTTGTKGSTTEAAEAMARRLLAAGVAEADVHVVGPHPRKGNLVARLRGTGARQPILLLAHIDVVDADGAGWSVEPFALTERDGHFYGRGTSDDKAMAALWTATLVRLRQEGFTPERDILVALTADEEGGDHNGAQWLLDNRAELVDAEFGLNEGGYGRIKDGKRIANQVQASEKVCVFFELEAAGRPGHSSLPAGDNAIHRLSRALLRLAEHRFPIQVTEVVRAFFARMAATESGTVAADMAALAASPDDMGAASRLCASPYYNALLRTTCTPTRLDAGQANNVLPRTARAVLDCRMLPGDSPGETLRTLTEVVADDGVEIRPLISMRPSPPSPLTPEILQPIERITEALWPGVPVVPVMSVGATDSLRFRQAGIPMYGVSGLFLDIDDVRAHAPDERILVESFYDSQEFLYRLVRALATPAVREYESTKVRE